MQVIRLNDAKPYEANNHSAMCGLRLQGWDASPTATFWTGLSYFLPHGGAGFEASAVERVYVIIEGELTVITDNEEVVLRKLDSCFIPANEKRALENRTNEVVVMLVVGQYPVGTTR